VEGSLGCPLFSMAVVRITLGVVFTLLGFTGLVLPVLPGWIFFFFAVLMFFPNTRLATKILLRIEPRFPRLARWMRRMTIE
jgi:uncharacterized membrane protein YbaN (DUF454 family)